MSFVKVWTDVGDTFVNLPARVIETINDTIRIQYLSQSDRKDPTTNKKIWSYEDEIYDITDESIAEYMYNESDLGFVSINENDYIKMEVSDDEEDDSDYEQPSDTDTCSEASEDDDDADEPGEEYDNYQDE